MRRLLVALLAFSAVGCGKDLVTGPDRQELLALDLSFYSFESSAYAAAEKSGAFWAVKGEDRAVVLRYGDTGAEFLRFEVGANSLYKRPDGTLFEAGDSILITVAVDGSGRMMYSFEPSGLEFDNTNPARLTLNYARADALSKLLGLPGIYQRNSALLPWLPLPTLNLSGDVARSDVHHFTDFALAVN